MSTKILAIDTTTEACSAALMLDENVFLERFILTSREHMQYILPMVDSLLTESGMKLKDLDALALSCGPGSFTGIRISICIAQGLSVGSNLPIIGVSTLTTLAEGAWRKTGIRKVLTAIDARMGEVYWAPYQRREGVWLCDMHEVVAKPETLFSLSGTLSGCWVTAGTGWRTYPTLFQHEGLELIEGNTLLPSARDILPLALNHYQHGETQSADLIEPNYLRNKAIWKKLPDKGD